MNRLILIMSVAIAAMFTFFASPMPVEAMQFEYPTKQLAANAVPDGAIVTDTSFDSGVGLRPVRYEVHRTVEEVFAQWDRNERRGEVYAKRSVRPYKCTKCTRPADALASMNAAVGNLENPDPNITDGAIAVIAFSETYHGSVICSLGGSYKLENFISGSNPELIVSAAPTLPNFLVDALSTIKDDPAPSADPTDNDELIAVDPDDVIITVWDDTAQSEAVALDTNPVGGDTMAASDHSSYGFHGALSNARAPYVSSSSFMMLRGGNNCDYTLYSTQSRLCSRPPEIPR